MFLNYCINILNPQILNPHTKRIRQIRNSKSRAIRVFIYNIKSSVKNRKENIGLIYYNSLPYIFKNNYSSQDTTKVILSHSAFSYMNIF